MSKNSLRPCMLTSLPGIDIAANDSACKHSEIVPTRENCRAIIARQLHAITSGILDDTEEMGPEWEIDSGSERSFQWESESGINHLFATLYCIDRFTTVQLKIKSRSGISLEFIWRNFQRFQRVRLPKIPCVPYSEETWVPESAPAETILVLEAICWDEIDPLTVNNHILPHTLVAQTYWNAVE